MKSKKILFLLLILLLVPCISEATQFLGGVGLFYTTSARTYVPGQLSFSLYTRTYAKPLTGIREVTSNTGVLCVNYGSTNHLELSLSQILYQDVNYDLQKEENTYMVPGYSQFILKMANYRMKMGQNFLFFGGKASITKQGKFYNSFLEPYFDIGIAAQIEFICSYYLNPYYPEESPALHLNVGYTHYNDAESLMESGQAIPLAIGYVKSNIKYDYSLELSGRFFVKEPYVAAYSREDYLYLTPGYKYKLYMGIQVGVAFDILLMTGDETTENYYAPFNQEYSQYPDWRLNLKVDYTPSTAFYQIPTFEKVSKEAVTKQTLRARRVITDKKSLFEWVVDENKGAEYIDLELEKIREERKRAEQELERLKKELEAKSQ